MNYAKSLKDTDRWTVVNFPVRRAQRGDHYLWKVSAEQAQCILTVQSLGFLPLFLHHWSKTPSQFNMVGRRQKLLQESSQPSLAHQSRKAAVGVKQALPGGIQAPTPAPSLLTAKHPTVLRHCSRDRFCSPCFYFRFDTVTMITAANISQ